MICAANQLTGFCMMRTLVDKGLISVFHQAAFLKPVEKTKFIDNFEDNHNIVLDRFVTDLAMKISRLLQRNQGNFNIPQLGSDTENFGNSH